MLTLKHLTDYPKTVKTLNKWIIARERTIHNITMPNQYFYIGDDADHNHTKLQQLHDAGFAKDETKGLQFINYYTAEDLAAIFGNEMEDRNRHSLTNLWTNILQSLYKSTSSLSDKGKCLILCDIYENTF